MNKKKIIKKNNFGSFNSLSESKNLIFFILK